MKWISGIQKFKILNEFLSKNIDTEEKCTVLDVGGTDSTEKVIKNSILPNSRVISVNINIKEIEKTEHEILGNACNLDGFIKNGSVDIVLLNDIIEHIMYPMKVIIKSIKVLKEGGLIVISSPNLASLYNRISLALGKPLFNYRSSKMVVDVPFRNPRIGGGHKSVFTHNELKGILKMLNLKIISEHGFTYGIAYKNKKRGEKKFGWIRYLINKVLPMNMKEGMLFIGRKDGKDK